MLNTCSEHPQVATALRAGYPKPGSGWTDETERDYVLDNPEGFALWASKHDDIVRDFVAQNLDDFYDWMERRL